MKLFSRKTVKFCAVHKVKLCTVCIVKRVNGMKKYIMTALGATLLHLGMCVVELIMWEWNIIDPMAGWDGYTIGKKSFFITLFVIITVVVTFLIKREKPIVNLLVFWLVSILLVKIIDVRIVLAELTDNIPFIYGTNWLGSDMWAVCFAGCCAGTIVGVLRSVRNGVKA